MPYHEIGETRCSYAKRITARVAAVIRASNFHFVHLRRTPRRQDITHLLRMEFSSDSTGKNRGVSQKTMPSYRQITTTSSCPTLHLATRKINVISRVFAVSSRCSLQRLRKLKLRDFGLLWEKRNILSSPPRTYTCKTEVRLLKGREEKERGGRTASDLPCLIFIGNERISFAFFLPFTISLG